MSVIYLLESKNKKNQCKVGKTTRDPEKRAKDYAGGGWNVYKEWSVPEISLSIYETRAHKSLKSYQVPSNEIGFREIFSINAKEALPIVDKSIEETKREIVKQEASNELLQAEKERQLEEKRRREQQQLEKQRQIEKNKEEVEEKIRKEALMRANPINERQREFYRQMEEGEKAEKYEKKQEKWLLPLTVVFFIILVVGKCSGS